MLINPSFILRFTQLVSVDFDTSGQIVSTSIQASMLEKTRVVRRPEGEPNFNIFYQMLAGLDPKTRRDLNLESLNDPNLFMTPLQRVSYSIAYRTQYMLSIVPGPLISFFNEFLLLRSEPNFIKHILL